MPDIDDVRFAETEFGAAYLAGVLTQKHETRDGTEYAYELGGDGSLSLRRLEQESESGPFRQKAIVNLADQPSFVAYLNAHAMKGVSAIFREPGSSAMRAVLDYHASAAVDPRGIAGSGDHVATFTPPWSKSWRAWMAVNRKPMTQEAFLELLEERVSDVVAPNYADLVELIQWFRVHEEVGFSSSRNLATGAVELSYSADPQAAGGRDGRLEVPGMIRVLMRPYDDRPAAAEIDARLRYRLSKNAVTFEVRFPEGLSDWLREVDEARANEVASLTGLPVYTGSTTMSR